MIAFDFEYYKPDTVEEAVNLFKKLDSSGKEPIYYAGGSEIISMARKSNIYTEAIIDIKGIEDCGQYILEDKDLVVGAGVALTKIAKGHLFPPLSKTVERIADHTMQGKITLGGNICGSIIYKEAVLPLLISDSEVVIANENGEEKKLLTDIFNGKLQLEPGDMLVKIIVPNKYLILPYCHVKRTKNEKIDYPLVSMVALRDGDRINIAFSGIGDYPFRVFEVEDILNNQELSIGDKIRKSIINMDEKIQSDLSGSKEYKKFILENVIRTALEELEEAN